MIRVTFTNGATEDREDASPARRIVDTKHGLRLADAPLRDCRGADDVEVERNDAWTSCLVETFEEQIARLTAERDAEKARADAAADLTAWAESTLSTTGWVRHGAGWIIPTDRDMCAALPLADAMRWQAQREAVARGAVERRLTDLRAWALKEADDMRGVRQNKHAAQRRRIIADGLLDVLVAVVARLDGTDGESK